MLDERDFQRIGQLFDDKMSAALKANNEENNKVIISAVAEMLEDNIFPQFAEIHREIRQLKIVAGWQS